MSAPPHPVIFDLDGTVWDSAPGILDCIEATLAEYDLPSPPRGELTRWLGPPLNEMLLELGVPDAHVDEARTVYRRHYREYGELRCSVYPGMPELLDRLREAGHPTATATSKGVDPTKRMLDHFGLRTRFDVVAAASMTATGHSKIDIIGTALDGLGDRSGHMIGDRSFDILGGRHHALTTVGVGWGYAPDGELEAAGAHHIVATVDELADLLVSGD